MATKKTDILEDFKQRSGQKRQYEEESVSSAGSSVSGQTDILEDFKQRSAGAQQRSAKRVSEIQKTAASAPKRVQSTSTKETTQKEQKHAALANFLRKDRKDTEKYLKETKIRQDTLKAKKAEIYADGDKASDQKIPEKFASDYAKTKLGIVEHGPFKEGLERITPYSELKKQNDYEVQKRKGAAIKTNPVAALDWSVVPGVQDYIAQAIKNPSQVSEILKQNNHIFQNMTQEEKDNYNYIYGKYGLEKANRYAESLDEQLNVRQGQSMVDMTQKIAEKNKLAGTAADIGLSFTAGMNRAVEGMGQAIDAVVGNPIAKPASAFDAYSGLLAEQSTGAKRAAQDIAGSIGFMMPSALMGGALGTVASEALFGVSAAGNAYADSIREGQNVNASKEYAIATGLSETISNLFLNGISAYGGGALKKMAGNTKVAKAASEGLAKVMKNPTAKRYLVRAFDYAADMGSEGLQEYTQEYMDKVTRNVLFGEDNKINPLDPDAWYAAMLGAATAGVMNAPNTALGLTYEDYFLRKLGKSSDINSYQDYVEGIETDQNAYQNQEQYEKAQEVRELAEELAQKQEAGEKISNLEKGYFEEAAYKLADSVAEDAHIEPNEEKMENSALTSENAQENDYRVPQGEELELWADGYETNGKKTFTESYDGETDISSYSKAFANYYNAGRYNMDNESVLGAAAVILSPEQAKAAYKAGALDRNAAEVAYDKETRSFTNMQKGTEKIGGLGTATELATEPQKKMAEYVGKRTGLKVNLVDSMSADRAVASYHNGEITISIDTKDFNGSVSHELTHFIKDYSPDMYQIYENRCMRAFADVEGFNTNELIENYMNRYEQAGQKLNREQAVEEIVADATQSFLNDEKFINEVVHDDRTLGQKIMDFIDDVIESIKSLIKTGSTRASAKALEQNVQALESARQAWHIALNESGERYRAGWEVKNESNTRYQLVGLDENGREVYETSEEVKNMTMKERKKALLHSVLEEFKGRTAKFEKDGEVYYALLDEAGARKGVYGDKQSNIAGYKEKIKIGADNNYFELVENADYDGSQKEQGKTTLNGAHNDTQNWDYYVKTIKADGNLYDVLVNVRDTGENQYIYDVSLRKKTEPASSTRSTFNQADSVIQSIADTGEKVNAHVDNAMKTDASRSMTGTSVGKTNLQLSSASHPSSLSLRNKIMDVNTKFQLKDPVEESENLIAVHNLDADKLTQMLKYDGIPMPSIAITKSEYGWNDFGDISLVFRKDTIDPANKKNKVYGADAWTPTFPQIEYNVNEGVYYDVGRTISDSMNGKVPDYLISEAKRFNDTMSGNPEKNGLDGVINAAQNNIGMKAAYLASKGEQIRDRVQEVDTPDITPGEETLYQNFLKGIPETEWSKLKDLLENGTMKEVRDTYGPMIVDAFIDARIKDGFDQEVAEKNRGGYKKSPTRMMSVLLKLKKAFNYQENGVHYTKETIRDEAGINEEINSKVDEAGYKEWLTNLYDGLVGEQGVPNGKEYLTPSGDRRTFRQLHYEVTPENIVKSMMSQGEDTKNVMGFIGIKTLRAAATENMRSIGEIHKNEDRLQNFSVEEYAAREDALNTRLYNVIDSIIKKTNSNGITDVDRVGEIIQEAAGKKNFSEKKVKETFAEYPYWVASTEDVKEITDIINEVKKMPVNMFEAKPERVVGYDEVAAAVVPSNIDDNVLQGLEDRGIKTVMYDPDTEGARKDAVNALEGIRFQLEDIDEGPSMPELVKENKKLKEANALLKKQFELTSKEEMRQSDIQKQVNKILKQYNSSWNQKTAVNNITKLYEYIRTGQVDMDQLTDVAADIGRTILNKSTVKDTTIYEQYKDTVNKIRNTKISLSDQDKADLATYGGYNAFRKQYFGRLKLGNNGISIDSLYEELSAEHPEVFKSDVTHPADRLINVANFLDAVRPTVENPYAANIDEMSCIVGQEILNGYNQIRNEAPTFADRKNIELIKVKDQYQKRLNDYKAKVKADHEAEVQNLRKKIVRDQQEAKYNAVWRDAEVHAQMMKFNERMKEKSDRDLRYKARKSIMKDARELQRWLLDPTDQKNIPKSMRGAIADMLSSIDVSKSYPAAEREVAWSRAQAMFSKIMNEGNVIVGDDGSRQYMEIDPNMIARFDSFINKERKTNEIGKSGFEEIGARLAEMKDIDDLSIHDLEEMKKLVSSVKKAIAGIGKQRRNERYENTSALATDVLAEVKDRKRALKLSGALDVGAKLLNYDMLDPQTMFGKIGPAFKTAYDGLRSGLDKKTICLQTAQNYFSDTLSSAEVSTKEIQKWMNEKAKEFETSGGKIKLSTAQIMSLYELDKRKAARQHIYDRKGGIKASDRKRGLIYETQDRAVRVAETDVKKICDTLTPKQKKVADALQQFMGNQVASWGNEVSMELYGYEKFTAEDYFPIMSDGTRIHRHEQDKMGESTIKNLGFTKKTNEYANNGIVINDIFDVFTRQVDQMSSYAGFVIPLSDLHQLIEYQQPDGGMAVKEEITRAFGDHAINYVDKLVRDINGGTKEDRTIQDFLMSNMKAASVAGNLRVAIQQPTSIARAVAEIDPKYLAMGATTMEKGRWDKITQYAPIAMWKDWGFYQMQVSRPMKDVLTGNRSKVQNLVNKTMVLAELGDKLTWNRIWSACEYEVADKHPDIEKGSEEFYQAAGKRFSEIIDKTQVVDSVLHRTQIMRSKNGLAKMATAFMGEPLKSYDMLYRAFYDVKAGREGAKKQLLRSTSAYVASAILTSIAAAVMDATRDDDRDKTWTEKYKASVWENFKDNINMLQNIPYLKDAISIAKGESIARTDMSAFQDLYYGFRKVEQLKKGESQYTPQYVALYTLQTMSKATSIPIKTLTRDTFSIIDSVMQGIGGETDYRWIRQKYDISQKKNLGMYSEMMLRAQSNGEKKLAAEIYNDLLENGLDNDTINNKIENVLKDAVKEDPMLQRLVEAKENLDTKAADEAYKELMDAGYNSDIVIAAVKAVTNSEKTELKKEEDFKKLREAREDSNEKAAEEAYKNLVEAGYNPNLIDKVLEDSTETYEKIEDLDEIFTEDKTLYQNSDVIQAIDAERWTDVDTMLKQIYESKKASSKKKKESEKAKDARARIKASLSAKYRKRYIAADSTEKQKIRGKLLRIRVDGKRLYDSDSFKTWKEEK